MLNLLAQSERGFVILTASEAPDARICCCLHGCVNLEIVGSACESQAILSDTRVGHAWPDGYSSTPTGGFGSLSSWHSGTMGFASLQVFNRARE